MVSLAAVCDIEIAYMRA